jgi:hypothetical protein
MGLHDGGDDRRVMPLVDPGAGQPPRCLELVGEARDPGEPHLHAFHLRDRHAELLAHPSVGPRRPRRQRRARRRQRRQRDGPAGGQRAHQHHPALADAVSPAEYGVKRQEHVLPPVRSVLERLKAGHVPTPDLDPRRVRGHENDCNPRRLALAQEPLRIARLHREAEHRRHRSERDVALVPGEPQPEDTLALPLTMTDDALVGH